MVDKLKLAPKEVVKKLTKEELNFIEFRASGVEMLEAYKTSYLPPINTDYEHLLFVAQTTESTLRGHITSAKMNKNAVELALSVNYSKISEEELKFVFEFLARSASSNRGRDAYRAAFDTEGMSNYDVDIKYPYLLKSVKIQKVLNEHRKFLEIECFYSIGEYVKELNWVVEEAKKHGNVAVMSSTIQAKGRIWGYDKKTIIVNNEVSGSVDLNLPIDDLIKKLKAEKEAAANRQPALLESLQETIIDIETD